MSPPPYQGLREHPLLVRGVHLLRGLHPVRGKHLLQEQTPCPGTAPRMRRPLNVARQSTVALLHRAGADVGETGHCPDIQNTG